MAMRSLAASTFFASLSLAATASTARACPYCDSEIGRQVAAGIFDASFFWNAAMVGLPIPILLALAMLTRFAPLPGLSAAPTIVSHAAEATDERPV